MKPKSKEKAIEVRVVSKGGDWDESKHPRANDGKFSEGPGNPGFAKDDVNNDGKHDGGAQHARDSNFGVGDKVKITGKVHGQGKTGIAVGFDRDGSFAMVRIGSEVYSYHNSDVSAADDEDDDEDDDEEKSFHSRAVEKPNPHMPGGSFSACVLIMEDKGHSTESAKKICGALQAESGEKLYDIIAEEVINKEVGDGRGRMGGPYSAGPGGVCKCPECGHEQKHEAGKPCTKVKCAKCGAAMARKEVGEGKKEYEPKIKLIRPAPSVKILFAPPTGDMIAAQVGEAVERALSRRTGKIL
jgi:ribosomal protein S27E